jgi:hypothetical protein
MPAPAITPSTPPQAGPPDPLARVRQRVTERIITKLAAAGMYDLNLIPLPELRRIVLAHVAEVCQVDRVAADDTVQERLTLEILSGMNR